MAVFDSELGVWEVGMIATNGFAKMTVDSSWHVRQLRVRTLESPEYVVIDLNN